MTAGKLSSVPPGTELKMEQLKKMMTESEWQRFQQSLEGTPEEAERILRESDWVDVAEVNQMLGFTEDELAVSLSPPSPAAHPDSEKVQ